MVVGRSATAVEAITFNGNKNLLYRNARYREQQWNLVRVVGVIVVMPGFRPSNLEFRKVVSGWGCKRLSGYGAASTVLI